MNKLLISTLVMGSVFNIAGASAHADCLSQYENYRKDRNDKAQIMNYSAAGVALTGLAIAAVEINQKKYGEESTGFKIALPALGVQMTSLFALIPTQMDKDSETLSYLIQIGNQERQGVFADRPSHELDKISQVTGNSSLLRAQPEKRILAALSRGSESDAFCKNGKLMSIAEVRSYLETDVLKHADDYHSDQHEVTMALIKKLEDRADSIEAAQRAANSGSAR